MNLGRAIFIFVLAPIGAAVVIAVLLLFGVKPPRVFFFGFAVRECLTQLGLPAPKPVGVLSTVFLFWLPVAAAGLLWDRRRRT